MPVTYREPDNDLINIASTTTANGEVLTRGLAKADGTPIDIDSILTAIRDAASMLTFNPSGAHVSAAVAATVATLAPPVGATKLLIQARQADVRYTLDGTDPVAGTTGTGFVLYSYNPAILIPIRSSTVVKVLQEGVNARIQYQWGT